MLKYLFTAEYSDGTKYVQNTEDKSIKEPEKRSCFFDVDHSKLVRFTLKGEGHEYAVDLKDGHFEINGVPFFAHEEEMVSDIQLIFWRKHKHHIQVGGTTGADEREKGSKEIGHEVSYLMGWQGKVPREKQTEKEVIQRIIQFK